MQLSNLETRPVGLRSLDGLTASVVQEWYGGDSCKQSHDDGDVSPFVRAVLAMVRRFVQSVDHADFGVREHFQEAIWTLGQLGVGEQQLGELFSTTANSVNRWMNGRSAPAPVMRALVIRAGLDLLRRDGMKIAGRYFDPITGRPKAAPE